MIGLPLSGFVSGSSPATRDRYEGLGPPSLPAEVVKAGHDYQREVPPQVVVQVPGNIKERRLCEGFRAFRGRDRQGGRWWTCFVCFRGGFISH